MYVEMLGCCALAFAASPSAWELLGLKGSFWSKARAHLCRCPGPDVEKRGAGHAGWNLPSGLGSAKVLLY